MSDVESEIASKNNEEGNQEKQKENALRSNRALIFRYKILKNACAAFVDEVHELFSGHCLFIASKKRGGNSSSSSSSSTKCKHTVERTTCNTSRSSNTLHNRTLAKNKSTASIIKTCNFTHSKQIKCRRRRLNLSPHTRFIIAKSNNSTALRHGTANTERENTKTFSSLLSAFNLFPQFLMFTKHSRICN
jgi:hypothetical protein